VAPFWSAKLVEGEDRRAQQVNVGLLCGQSHFHFKLFWLYFRMGIKLFNHIAECVMKYDTVLEQTGELGDSTAQKVTATLQMLAYDIPFDLKGNMPKRQ
jgi:hypothetical protein